MTNTPPLLHLVCGKIAAGKSTLCLEMTQTPSTILLSEDALLSALYSNDMKSFDDYVKYSARLKTAMEGHIVSLLQAGISVVLDFPANTVQQRRWMLGLAKSADVEHTLHYLDVAEELCRERLRQRNNRGSHEFAASDAEFDLISSYFVSPDTSEGLNIVLHSSQE